MIGIKRLDTRVLVERTLVYALDGAPDTVRRYGSRVFRPTRIDVHMVDGKLAEVSVSGPWLLKNGRHGERLHNSYYGGVEGGPEWLRAVVDQVIADGATT